MIYLTAEQKALYLEVSSIMAPHKVYLVGGCLRDIILGKEPKDYDFTTPATPEEIEACIKNSINEQGNNRRAYTTGAKFGTLGCKVFGKEIEITTFRTEVYDRGSRKPAVKFVTDIKDDLKRRDFTINAMAWNIEDGLIDYFNGIEDSNNKIIRAVGQPKERFTEDALRLLRCARFASQLNFTIDPYTEKKALECARMILSISKERWMMELNKILLSDNPRIGLQFLMRTRLFNYMIPELALQYNYNQNSKYHDFDLWEHTLRVVEAVSKETKNLWVNKLSVFWSALLHDIGKPFVATVNKKSGYTNYVFHERVSAEIVLKYAQYLKWPNDLRDNVYTIVKDHLKEDSILRPYDIKGHKQ